MVFRNLIAIVYVSISTCTAVLCQETPAPRDTSHIYEEIKTYSKRSRFHTFVYQLIFKPNPSPPEKKKSVKKGYKKLIQKPYSSFEGKVVSLAPRHPSVVFPSQSNFQPISRSSLEMVLSMQFTC